MKKIFVISALIGIFCLGAYSVSGYDIFRGKTGPMFDKNGLKEKISASQISIPGAVTITSPANGTTFSVSSITVMGTSTGKVDTVSVSIGSGPWVTAAGTASGQHTFTGVTNGTYTIKAHAANTKGAGPDSSISVTMVAPPRVVIISGPTNSYTTNQSFSVTLSVDKNSGYWSTNSHPYSSFPAGTVIVPITTTRTLRYYGQDIALHTSSTQVKIYTIDTAAPLITVKKSNTSPATIWFTVDESFGFWSTNAGATYHQFPKGTTNVPITSSKTFKYYGQDKWGNTSSTQTSAYVITNYFWIYSGVHMPTDFVYDQPDPRPAFGGHLWNWGGGSFGPDDLIDVPTGETKSAVYNNPGGLFWIFADAGGTKFPEDLSKYSSGHLNFWIKTTVNWLVKLEEAGGAARSVNLNSYIVPSGAWQYVSIPFTDFAGLNFTTIAIPLGLHNGPAQVKVSGVNWCDQ
jgi:hypothetical protein